MFDQARRSAAECRKCRGHLKKNISAMTGTILELPGMVKLTVAFSPFEDGAELLVNCARHRAAEDHPAKNPPSFAQAAIS
jgi:hypothetical protein